MSNKLGGRQGTSYLGTNAASPPNWTFHTDSPTIYNSQNFSLGDMWLNTTLQDAFVLTSLAFNHVSNVREAVWFQFANGPQTGTINQLIAADGTIANPLNGQITFPNAVITANTNPVSNILTSVQPNNGSDFLINLTPQIYLRNDVVSTDSITLEQISVSGGAWASTLKFLRADGTIAAPTAVSNNFGLGSIRWFGYTDTGYTGTPSACIKAIVKGAVTGTPQAVPTCLAFAVSETELTVPFDLASSDIKLQIDPNGQVWIKNCTVLPGDALTVTSGNINITGTGVGAGGNIKMPATNAGGTQGVVTLNTNRFISNYLNTTAVGINASNFTHTGLFGAAFGNGVLSSLTTGVSNSGFGNGALTNCTEGANNSCFGYVSGFNIITGNGNCGYGDGSILNLNSGDNNTAIGGDSLANLLTGDNNICVGDTSGFSYTGAESSNICVGNSGIVAENNTIRVGTSGAGVGQQNRFFAAGIRGITTGVNDAIAVLIDSAGQLGTVSSSIRYKENVQDMGLSSDNLMKLRPVTFNYKEDASKSKAYGLIAEEVAEIFPDLVVYNPEGEIETVKYHLLASILLNEVQKLSKRIEHLESKLKELL
jgi:hypothetical protein